MIVTYAAKFIGDSSPYGNKAGMRHRPKGVFSGRLRYYGGKLQSLSLSLLRERNTSGYKEGVHYR
jgi:hypothetical protein